MQKQIFGALILIFICVLSGFGQKSEEQKQREKRERQEQLEKSIWAQQEAESERLRQENANRSGNFSGLRLGAPERDLLPAETDAWVLRIVTSGGFSGEGLPTLTLFSNGNFVCGDDETQFQLQPLDPDKLQSLAQVVKNSNFLMTDSSPKIKNSASIICNDCYQTTIYLTRRENGKTKFYANNSKLLKYVQIAEFFNQIQQNTADLTVCRN